MPCTVFTHSTVWRQSCFLDPPEKCYPLNEDHTSTPPVCRQLHDCKEGLTYFHARVDFTLIPIVIYQMCIYIIYINVIYIYVYIYIGIIHIMIS